MEVQTIHINAELFPSTFNLNNAERFTTGERETLSECQKNFRKRIDSQTTEGQPDGCSGFYQSIGQKIEPCYNEFPQLKSLYEVAGKNFEVTNAFCIKMMERLLVLSGLIPSESIDQKGQQEAAEMGYKKLSERAASFKKSTMTIPGILKAAPVNVTIEINLVNTRLAQSIAIWESAYKLIAKKAGALDAKKIFNPLKEVPSPVPAAIPRASDVNNNDELPASNRSPVLGNKRLKSLFKKFKKQKSIDELEIKRTDDPPNIYSVQNIAAKQLETTRSLETGSIPPSKEVSVVPTNAVLAPVKKTSLSVVSKKSGDAAPVAKKVAHPPARKPGMGTPKKASGPVPRRVPGVAMAIVKKAANAPVRRTHQPSSTPRWRS